MPKSPKPKKGEKSLEGKSSAKKKSPKQKLSDTSKSNAVTEDIKNAVIEDEKWQCSTVLLVPQTHSLHDFLLQLLSNLPENFTVLTKEAIANAKDKKSQNKSRKGSNTRTSIRSTSKDSKQSGKSKATKSKNKSKKDGVEKTDPLVESSNDEDNRSKVCLELKKRIIGLRNNDIANINQNITDNKTDMSESKTKNKEIRTRGSGDEVENNITVTEENLKNDSENILHRFVILLGFYDPLLPEALHKLNVSMKAIINVSNAIDSNIHIHSSNERLSTVTAKSKRKPSVKSKKGSVDGKVSSEYSVFLQKIIAFSSTSEFLEKSKDVVFLNYTMKNMSKTKEIGLQYNLDMLEIFYKIKDAWNKYKVYTETIHVQNIPTPNESLKIDDAKIYCTMVSMVPLECTSIAVILHCILEQIAWWNDDKHLIEETEDCLLSNNCSDSRNSASKPSGKNKTPILIHHRDEVKYNTYHLDLPEFDFEQISTNIFMKSPVFKLWERYPPHSKSVQNWFNFQLQKLQNLSENCIYKQDRLFPIYLNTFLMDVLISKTNQFTNSNHDTISSEIKKTHQTFFSGKEPKVCDSNSTLFIKEIIHNILCKVPHYSLCQNYAEVFEVVPYFSEESTQCSPIQYYTNRLKNKPSTELHSETLLQKRTLHKQEKLNKLVSFLNCTEFVNLYEELTTFNFRKTNRLAKYEFIEILNTTILCQCLQLASQAFSNISYDYFPVTDSILLWFNNSVENQVLSSCSSAGILETPLGFRDFYYHKLRESTDFGNMIEEVASIKSFKGNGDSFVDEFKADLESSTDDYHSKFEDNVEKHVKVEAPNPKIVYNLGSLWMESTESFSNFFSVDSSSVTVKRENYFNNKTQIVVNVNKNNTSIRYELDPENSKNFVQLLVDVHETLNLNCVFKWEISEISSIQRKKPEFSNDFETEKDSKFKLNSTISITLPSGLFIEVVPTNSFFGPFYVRQRYLGKGPNCSSIWEETYRCYFNNGMVLIFRVDGSIDILYNNGTTVKCHSLELIKPDGLFDTEGNEIDTNIKDAANGNLNQDGTHRTKESPNNKQKKKGKIKADPSSDVDGKETKKQSQLRKDKVKKEPKVITENREEKLLLVKEIKEEIPFYKVVEHSVQSWDGEYSQFDTVNCKDMKKLLSLRSAFDIINHELYWQRSDGMSGLQAPSNHMIKFPDGSKTTSFTIDNKELWVENDYAIIYDTSGDLVRVESLNTNSIGVELNKSTGNEEANHKKNVLDSDIPRIESFGKVSIEQKSFVYIDHKFLMEHKNYASVEYSNEELELKLTLPGNCWIIVDKSGRFSFKGNQNERIILFDDNLLFEANVLNSSTLSKSSTTFRFENVDTIPTIFSQTEDSFGNIFSIDERGNTTYLPSVNGEIHDQSSSSLYSTRFPQNTERFFVLNRDLTGYELIHEAEQENSESIQDVKTVNTPVVKDDDELYSVYMQAPIYRSKCEEYIMHDDEPVTPSLIKRKDLLKAHKTPETIWFYPNISSVNSIENNEINTSQSEKTLKAVLIVHRLKVRKKGLDVVSFFSKSLTKYMGTNEQVYQKYSLYHPEETLSEGDLVECEKNRMNFLGSKSYYLTDNLPVVITGGVAKENESSNDIFSIFSPAVSKVSF